MSRPRTKLVPGRNPRDSERAQQAADLYIEMAQYLERLAKAYRERATHYRRGELEIGYNLATLPADAGEHMKHPARRAIDAMSQYDVTGAYERIGKALEAIR